MNARELAVKVIYSVEFDGAYSNIALKDALGKSGMSPKDKALATRLVYGVISRRDTLDYVIKTYSKIKLKKISKYILIILRIGLYQLMYMDKIPESAAVNESVKLAKRYGHGASAGFVNGILRSYIRNGAELNSMSVKYSFPEWLCEKWTKDFGEEFTAKLMEALNEEPYLTIRPNTLKTSCDELVKMLAEKGIDTKVKGMSLLCGGFDVAADELYKNGYYTVQDFAASEAAAMLSPKQGEVVIDMCAAPGGKTTHLAELMGNEGKIYAFDIHEHKIELISKNAKRLGIDIIDARIGDGTERIDGLSGKADKVLCDVPCSGLGVIRRKPDIKRTAREDSNLPEIQAKILENGSSYLKNGGEILYSTCTINREENENVTAAFLESHKEFEKIFEKTYYPHIDGCDGFYICKMRKK